MKEQTRSVEQSKTIQGIVITLTCIILAAVANIAGVDYDTGQVTEVMTIAVANISAAIGSLYGLYRAWEGRMNPNIKVIEKGAK